MDLSRTTFLVVEDQEFQRRMLSIMLHDMQAHGVHCVADGRAALDFLETPGNTVDVIVSDLDMPEMDGMEFIRHVAQRRRDVTIIIASSASEEVMWSVETMATAYGAKLLGCIRKPVTPAKLRALLEPDLGKARDAAPADAEETFSSEAISAALERGEIEPFFQPKVEIASGRIIGAEALARWRHPRSGIVSPCRFIGELERDGSIDALMHVMLRQSAGTCMEWHAAGNRDMVVCVNIAAKSLHDVRLAEDIAATVRSAGVEARHVVLEVTESTATTQAARVLENLARLRMKGFGLAIDDFGTGYSSLEQLARTAFTELKIDHSFVMAALRRPPARVILESSLDMAHRLGIVATAEAVESEMAWQLLETLGCDIAQGCYIAPPMSATDFAAWLAARIAGTASPP